MALKTVLVPDQQSKLMGCIICDHTQNLCICKPIKYKLGVTTTEKRIGEVQSPAELLSPLVHLGYPTHYSFVQNPPSRSLNRKKSKSKFRPTKKSTDKVFPEELLDNVNTHRFASSSKSLMADDYNEEVGSTETKKSDSCPTVRQSLSCVDLEIFSETVGFSDKEFLERSGYDIYDRSGSCVCSNLRKSEQTVKCKLECPQCSSLNKGRKLGSKKGTSVNNNSKKVKTNHNTIRRKDHGRWTWKGSHRGKSRQSTRETMSLPDQGQFDSISDSSDIQSHQSPFYGDDLSATTCASTEAGQTRCARKTMDSNEDTLFKGVFTESSLESSSQATERRVGGEFPLSVYCRNPPETVRTAKMGTQDAYKVNIGQTKNKSCISYRRHKEPLPFHTKLLQRQFSHESSTDCKDQSKDDVVPTCIWIKSPVVKPVEQKNPRRLVNVDWKVIPSLESKITSRIKQGHDINQHQSLRKWIPVTRKEMNIQDSTLSDVNCNNRNDYSPLTETCLDQETTVISNSVPGGSSDVVCEDSPFYDNMTPSVEKPIDADSTNSKDECGEFQQNEEYIQPIQVQDDSLHLLNYAKRTETAFITSYKFNLASERVQKTIGYPVAEFENLLSCMTPVLASSTSSKTSDDFLHNVNRSLFLCRNQLANKSLDSIWNWYEEPGNYGLKVNADYSVNQTSGCVADTTTLSHVHFVPLLSAVQLFGYSHFTRNHAVISSQNGSTVGNSLSNVIKLETAKLSADSDKHDTAEPTSMAGSSSNNDAQLIFEFFESEQPQRRMPLHKKIMELASGEASNSQVFGDPSKLEGTNLEDLHPSSWFSVAWYPIYRIPEGKLRAAFLTYHSLGYLVQRCIASDFLEKDPSCLVLPVIGLQSYNAQGEMWFSPRTAMESSLREETATVLRERLRALEDNALFFARGVVSKDNVIVTNKQPDYEFFMTRKQ